MPTSNINTKFDLKQDAVTFVIVIAACFIQALAINGFYVPHSFLSGGVTGVALLLDYVFDIPSWIPIIILNIPISIIGLKYLNAKFIIFSVIGTLNRDSAGFNDSDVCKQRCVQLRGSGLE